MCNFPPLPVASPFLFKYSSQELNAECVASEVLTAVNINFPSSSP
jgi:hypothetical protein